MKEYKYTEKEVLVMGKKYDVIVPETHSKINELILVTVDLNALDRWANISRWHTTCMVLKKGRKQWEILYDGSARGFKLNDESMKNFGIYSVLFQLETKRVRNNFHKREEIKELENRINKDSKRLKKLRDKNEKHR